MGSVNAEIKMQGNNDAWFTDNASEVFEANIQIFHIDGRYKFTDGVTSLSILPFLGTDSGGDASNNVYASVFNGTGNDIPSGKVVFFKNENHGYPSILLAIADSSSAGSIIGVTNQLITDNNVGIDSVTIVGIIDNLDTSSLTEGEMVYVSTTTAGDTTTTIPVAPYYVTKLGYCLVQDGTNGKIFINQNDSLSNNLDGNRKVAPTVELLQNELAKKKNITDNVLKQEVKLSTAISKGQAVYISSANGTNIIVSKASNATEATSSKTLGLLETGGSTNAIVNVITDGLLDGLNTSTATIGDPVWLGVNGDLIYGLASKPVAPAHLVYIGVVSRVSATVGEILIKVQNGFELNEIHDVLITSKTNEDFLQYESASGLWKNIQLTANWIKNKLGITTLSGSNTGDEVLNSTQIAVGNGSNKVSGSSELTYDSNILKENASKLPSGDSAELQVGGRFMVLGDLSENDQPTFIEFFKGNGSGTTAQALRGAMGFHGVTEVNQCINMDYRTGVHKYYDATLPAAWTYLGYSNGFGMQYVPANNPNSAIFSTYGCVPWKFELLNQPVTGKGIDGFSKLTTARIELANSTDDATTSNPKVYLRNLNSNLVLGTDSGGYSELGNNYATWRSDSSANTFMTLTPSGLEIKQASSYLTLDRVTGGASNLSAIFFKTNGTFDSYFGVQRADNTGLFAGITANAFCFNSSTNDLFMGGDTSGARLAIKSNGNIGVGVLNPLAILDIGASTTARASMRLPIGVAPTAPNDGDIYRDSSRIKFYDGTTTNQLAYLSDVSGVSRVVTSIATTTSALGVSNTDYIYLCNGTFTITLPTAIGNNSKYTIKNVGTGTITINTTSSQTIDGSTTIILATQYESLDLISDNANFNII